MDYKIKFTWRYKFLFVFILAAIFAGGALVGNSFVNEQTTVVSGFFPGLLITAVFIWLFILCISSGDSSMLEVDVDSFTEAAIE